MTDPRWPASPPVPPRRSPHVLRWVAGGLTLALVAGALLVVGAVALVSRSDERHREEQAAQIVRFDSGAGLVVVPGAEPGEQPDMIGQTTTSTDDGTRVEIVRSNFTGDVSWRNRVDGDGARARVVGLVDDLVLVVVDDRELVALEASDGSDEWTRPANVIDPTCADCLEIVGTTLLVRSSAGDVWGLDPSTGEGEWYRPAEETPRSDVAVVAGEQVVVAEDRADGDGVDLVVLDPSTGDERQRLAPDCTVTTDLGSEEVRPAAGTVVQPISGTADVAVAFGDEARCVQRWDTETGEQVWATVVDRGYAGVESAIDDERLVLADAGGVIVIDLDDGTAEVRPGPVDEGGTAAPLAFAGDVVVATERVDGRRTGRLLTWDLGAPDDTAGSATLEADAGLLLADRVTRGGVGAVDDPLDVLVPTGDGLEVITLPPDLAGGADPTPPTVTVGAIDLRTGTRTDRATVDLRHDPERLDPGLVWFHGVVDEWAAVTAGDVPQLVDLATGEIVAAWPVPG